MANKVLIYLLRRDLRVADNPILHEIGRLNSQSQKPFTHVLPLYIFPAQQVEVSGFISSQDAKSPYPEARSQTGNFWRCGHLRSKFLAESVWEVKKGFQALNSDLVIRVGMIGDVIKQILDGFEQSGDTEVTGLWITEEVAVEEKREERAIRREMKNRGKDFKVFIDEKYLVDDRDLPFDKPNDVPDVFTSYKKMVEPLRDAPRRTHPKPSSLPPLPSNIPEQISPFSIPSNLNDLIAALHKPLGSNLGLKNPPKMPQSGASTAIPFPGGESAGHDRIKHLLSAGALTTYKDTRNGLLGVDFSSKFSAHLALGCITARQVHFYMLDFENGSTDIGKGAQGYGKGENKGTGHMRFELLWRDYMRLVAWKFGPRLFRPEGFRNDTSAKWSYDTNAVRRWQEGTTGTGLIDASQRELFLTGYTSNRARQNVASYLAKHLGLDWRLGAEWYECCLVDYDVHSNWGNWQYTAGVGNDPREGGGGRKFNPVKQASDYDSKAEYVMAWVPETRGLKPEEAWQYFTIKDEGKKKKMGEEAEEPMVRIQWSAKKGGPGRR
ncbi:MAG: hypothetical protein Q9162_007091 [Coniocarpon cinnabarinum]